MRRGKTDNYWWTHAAGPAGPCSEIFVDRGARFGPDGGPDVDEDRFMEIWNHVFMQHQVDEHAEIVGELPMKNIDTGSSIERVAVVLQDVGSFFETDLFAPLLDVVQSLSGKHYGADERHDIAIRIIGEHARATAFLVADGVQPSNEGRGYILRRMLRRVVSTRPPARGPGRGAASARRSGGRGLRRRVPGARREPRRSSSRCSARRRSGSAQRCARA